MDDPLFDLDVNTTSQFRFLELLRRENPTRRVVYTSTRQIFGKPRYLPVDEEHPVAPVDVNGITKYATEQLHLLYHDVYGLPATRGATHERVRAAPAPARRPPGLPADLRAPRARRRGDHACSATASSSATASTSTTSSSACCSRRRRRRGARRDLQRRERRAPVVARDRRRGRRGRRVGPRRARAVAAPTATPSTSARTSATRRRRSGCWAGSRARRSPTGSPARSRSTARARSGTCDPDPTARPTTRSRSSTSPGGPRRSSPSSPRRSTRVVRSGSYLFGPELAAFEAEFAAFAGRRHAVGVASGTEALRLVAASRSASDRATR